MISGIIYVAFGEQYENLAAHTIAYSRQYTNIPITVIVNNTNRCEKWKTVKHINFIELPWSQELNRQAKTSINIFTPYDKTLYLDCDAVIQKKGVEKVFDYISNNGILLNVYGRWTNDKQLPSLYKRAFKIADISLPINIYYGAICGFCKNENTKAFFQLWNKYWIQNGAGREMPSLACAVKNSKISVVEMGNKEQIFSWVINKNAIIQHEYGSYVRKMVGCPEFKAYKPFDKKPVTK